MVNTLIGREGLEFLDGGEPAQGGVRAVVVVEVQEAMEGMLSWAWLAEGAGFEAFLVQGAVGAFYLAVLLGHGHWDELVADPQGAQGFLKGVGLLHVGEKDIRTPASQAVLGLP